jgi:hypothetical protein
MHAPHQSPRKNRDHRGSMMPQTSPWEQMLQTRTAEVTNMAKLSSAAWIAHDVGLAAAIGGTMFGREALQPALHEISDRKERDQVSDTAWRRFSWINLAGHAVVAATWFFGRSLLSGRSVSPTARRLTVAKDVLVVASLATGLASIILGRVLGSRVTERRGSGEEAGESGAEPGTQKLRNVVSVLGMANLAANVGIAGVTTALSVEASQSLPFSLTSRRLP